MRNPYWRTRVLNTPFVTYGLLGITVLVYLLEVWSSRSLSIATPVLWLYGARWNNAILLGQWWRFVTPIFVHLDLMHIAVNGISLFYLGVLTEKIFGHWRFFVVYMVGGIAGNIASFAFNGTALAAGASTAIFGLMGAFLFLGDTFRGNPTIAALSRNFVMLAGINLVFNLFGSGVDIFGHIGGFIGGFLIAGIVGAPNLGPVPRNRRLLLSAVLAVTLVAVIAIGFANGFQNL